MRFIKRIMLLIQWVISQEERGELFIYDIVNIYNDVKRYEPWKEMHYYLARTWQSYGLSKSAPDPRVEDLMLELWHNATARLLWLKEDFAPRALGILLLYTEDPMMVQQSQKLMLEFQNDIEPYLDVSKITEPYLDVSKI